MNHRTFNVIFLLPNLFTAASIFTGVVSIVAAIHGEFAKAAWLVFLSLLFDGLDGRVARLTHTTSRFGIEFDSLADLVAFGVAPALLVYFYAVEDLGRFGVLATALYIVFGAVRLARFNVMSPNTDPSVFIGLPIPTAAVFLAVWVLMFERYALAYPFGPSLGVASLVLSLLMVSNVRYPSFKKINLRKPMLFKTLVLLIVVASLLYLFPIEGLALLVTLYVLWGPVRAVYTLFGRKKTAR